MVWKKIAKKVDEHFLKAMIMYIVQLTNTLPILSCSIVTKYIYRQIHNMHAYKQPSKEAYVHTIKVKFVMVTQKM